jgi:lipopolysaccharide biosynthesis glycosyltransferase
MGMDVKYNAHPNFNPRHPKKGKCRNNGDYCEDCRKTPVEQVYNVHYTQCRKPWNCISVGYPGGHYPNRGKASAIDTNAGDLGTSHNSTWKCVCVCKMYCDDHVWVDDTSACLQQQQQPSPNVIVRFSFSNFKNKNKKHRRLFGHDS